jgi:hypothetical protein
MRDGTDDPYEFIQWALVVVVLALGVVTDPLVQRMAEARYRLGWFVRDFYVRASEWIALTRKRRQR